MRTSVASREDPVKKLLLLALGAAAAAVAAKRAQDAQHDQAVWAEVSDPVDR